MTPSRLLTLDDIADQRAYERERDEFRARVIATKKLRRIGVEAAVRVVDETQYQRRRQRFDYDMIPALWQASASPSAASTTPTACTPRSGGSNAPCGSGGTTTRW